MLVNIISAKCEGITAQEVDVEVDMVNGIGIHLVGLADIAVKESLLRTMTALQSMGYRIPGRKIVINLAPADLHKSGSGYDVAIALGILAVSGQVELPLLGKYMIMGELGLDGTVREIRGALPIADLAIQLKLAGCILPERSAMEAYEFDALPIFGVRTLEDIIRILSGKDDCGELIVNGPGNRQKVAEEETETDRSIMDFEDICGQYQAKRGVEIACAGGHNVLLIGPPGIGKSSIANAMVKILPPMTREESIQTSKIWSVAGKDWKHKGLMKTRPFRAPHYTSSPTSIIGGGGDNIVPGEISLAHNGIFFADEFCEAPKKMLEILRGPMEDRKVTISRLRSRIEYPSNFMLVAATNPCPCGYYGEGDRCTCSPGKRDAYLAKLSGPLMDRIDLQIWMHSLPPGSLIAGQKAESSAVIARRVKAAREIQQKRFAGEGITTNSEMNLKQIRKFCLLNESCRTYLEKMMENVGFSARACTRLIKLARTIADLDQSTDIQRKHLTEAISYRFLDKHLTDL